MPFSTRKAQCNLLISAELCSCILGMCNPQETSSTSTLNAPKILSLSVFECPVALTMGWMVQGVPCLVLHHKEPLCQSSSPPNYTDSELMLRKLIK